MQYTLREVVQNRLLWIVLFFALIGIGGAAFVGDLAIIENRAVENFAACRRVSLLCRVCHGDCSHFHYRAGI